MMSSRLSITFSLWPCLFMQARQLQLVQYMPAAKQSQYSLRHWLFLQWHVLGELHRGARGAGRWVR